MATLAEQRMVSPTTQTAMSMTDARRQIAASPTLYKLPTSGTGATTPVQQIRNSQGQLGAAINSVGQQPTTGPVIPGPQDNPYATDFAKLRGEIGAFGSAPTLDDATLARARALESQRLGNLYRGQLDQLGAAAASQGALGSGAVGQIAAGFAAQRAQQEADLGVKFQMQGLEQQREDYYRQLGLASDIAARREGFAFQRGERESTQGFNAREAELDRKWRTGERLSTQEWQELENARQRQFQTGERVGSQQFTAEESAKQRALVTDENAKDRLTQVALAEKQIEAQRANLEAQLAQARSENNLDRIQQLTVQKNQLDQQYASMRQQNDQFLTDMGLRRDVFERGKTEFDLTRTDQIDQWTQTFNQGVSEFDQRLGFDRDQLNQALDISKMDDQTRRYVAELNAAIEREKLDALDPGTLATVLGSAGQIADIIDKLGVGDDVKGVLKDIFGLGGGGGGATSNELEGLKDAAGAGTGGGIPWGTIGQAAVGAAGAYGLIESFNDPKGMERTMQAIASGAAIGSVLPGIGTLLGAGVGAVVGAFTSAFGPSASTRAKDAFTKQFDEAYRGLQANGALLPSGPNSLTNPANRIALGLTFASAVQQAAAQGTGGVEISDPDFRRLEGLGLAADVKGTDRNRFFAIDDPRLIALMGKGGPTNQYFTFEMPHQANDQVFADAKGGIGAFIRDGTLIVRDAKTGEVIDLNNAEQLKQIAARNSGETYTTPPKQAEGVA